MLPWAYIVYWKLNQFMMATHTKKNIRNYTKEDLQRAVAAIKDGDMSTRAASKMFDTLRYPRNQDE